MTVADIVFIMLTATFCIGALIPLIVIAIQELRGK